MYECVHLTKAFFAFKHILLFLLIYNHPQHWNEVGTFLSALLLSLLKLLSGVLQFSSDHTSYSTTHPNCCRPSCFLSCWILHPRPALPPLAACGGSFQIQNLVYKTANECTSASLKAMFCPGSTSQPVNALHSAKVVCLALLIMWPDNHSSQPWLLSFLALKNIGMTFRPQPGPKSNPNEAEN